MDNSEEDAGAATIASRRVSAREKQLGVPEEAPSSNSAIRDTQSVGSMGEEASDLDSMPSPGAHDANTSTEAILDMIDEFVDGPAVSRRVSYPNDPKPYSIVTLPDLKLEAAPKAPDPEIVEAAPLSQEVKTDNAVTSASLVCTNIESVQPSANSQSASAESIEPLAAGTPSESVNNEIELPSIPSHSDVTCTKPKPSIVDCSVECLQSSSSESEVNIVKCRSLDTVQQLATGESSNFVQPDLPSTSANQNNENMDHSASVEKTVNSATTSEVTDRLTVSVESTSNENSVSVRVNNESVVEQSTHSPLKRRLVRPAPSDRPPDCTVSSTVDSQTDVNIIGQSDCITKDVSSSSDAVPVVHDYVKPQEIRNISEVSFCQAETSVNPRKIKLVRPKPTTTTLPVLESSLKCLLSSETESCQPSSSGSSLSLLKLLMQNVPDNQDKLVTLQETSSTQETTQSQAGTQLCEDTAPSLQCPEPESSNIDKQTPQLLNESKCELDMQPQKSSKEVTIQLLPETETVSTEQDNKDLPKNSNQEKVDCTIKDMPAKKLPPLKINLQRSNSPCSSTVDSVTEKESQRKVPPLKLSVPNREHSPKKQAEDIHKIENEKKVPPLKLSKVCDSESSSNFCSTSEKKVSPLKLNVQTSEPSTTIAEAASCSEEKKVPPIRITTATCETSSTLSEEILENKFPPLKLTVQTEEKKIPPIKINTHTSEVTTMTFVDNTSKTQFSEKNDDNERKVPPIKLFLTATNAGESSNVEQSEDDSDVCPSECDSKVPKLTIKIGTKQSQGEEVKFPIPKLTIKPLKLPNEEDEKTNNKEQFPAVTKLNIKAVSKPAEKINEVHRKSSSSEISESEYSENEESASTSDQTSASDQGVIEEVPKVTIKMGKSEKKEGPGTKDSNIPKFTIKGVQNCDTVSDGSSQLKLLITESNKTEKVPKLTIKSISKTHDQPLSPKLTIKQIKPPDYAISTNDSDAAENQPIPKLRISTSDMTNASIKENAHVPKITIKPISRSGPNSPVKISKKLLEGESENFPMVTKINIKPVIKPQDPEVDEMLEVPVVSKLNIKPVVKPSKDQDSVLESKNEDVNKLSKSYVKHSKIVEELNVKTYEDTSTIIPNVTKINIKPIVKPDSDDNCRDSENQSSETGNSSDDNTDVPIVTKINIKPICNPAELDEKKLNDNIVPIVTKLNIKPVVDPNESGSLSPKLDGRKLKLNIKPIVKPDEDVIKILNEEAPIKNPPLLMKINKRVVSDHDMNHSDGSREHLCNNMSTDDKINAVSYMISEKSNLNCISVKLNEESSNCTKQEKYASGSTDNQTVGVKTRNKEVVNTHTTAIVNAISNIDPTRTSVQNCTLLKKLLENKSDFRMDKSMINIDVSTNKLQGPVLGERKSVERTKSPTILNEQHIILTNDLSKNVSQPKTNESSTVRSKLHSIRDKDVMENITKPLEINISERVASPSSGQDSPRIILKINKTDHGSSAQIITEETRRPDTPKILEECPEKSNESPSGKKVVNSRRKQNLNLSPTVDLGKRLRSSKIVNTETPPPKRQYAGKRQPAVDVSPPQNKQPELSMLEAKRLRLGQILSNKNLTVAKISPPSPQNKPRMDLIGEPINVNHSILNNENCSKNGNSKLHSILSNLAAKQIQALPLNDINCADKNQHLTPDLDTNISTGSTTIEVVPVDNLHLRVQEMMVNENSDSRDCIMVAEEVSRDPLEDESKEPPEQPQFTTIPVEIVPTPRKRGRPRKLPVSDETKTITLPVTALEERPQRSLRLSRERPAVIAKPRGRARGRAAKRNSTPPTVEPTIETANAFFAEHTPEATPEKQTETKLEDIDPTSSRIKLPRMTEALDKSVCNTPLSSRRRSSELRLFGERTGDTASVDALPKMEEALMKSPAGRGGRGARGARGRGRGTPRGARGRARGGGKGAQYMRETMGIYGRVCGPATTTVELFEEEAQMMEDSATPSKPSHLMDEDSQSSVKSSTNDTSNLKKSKYAELFDSNRVWMASDVKEYTWPPPEQTDVEHQVMMIQEQIALFLGVKSFKRRYPELRRRPILGEEKEYVLSQGVASEALCELGITAVDASEVLDIMLSDFPHKYEEYRQHQRVRQLAEAAREQELKPERPDRVEMKLADKPAETKVEKVDPEKTRQEMARAAAASAAEFNSRLNAARRPAAVDLQSLTVLRRRAPPPPPALQLRPPAGYYPHALLPGQYQHHYTTYTADQLRYFPLNTVVCAPPAPASAADSASDSEPDPNSSDDEPEPAPSKRRKVTKTKRSSQIDTPVKREEERENVELCRVCNLRLEANRKFTHERFLVCSSCNANLHPGCLELNADTIRKCREYPWQCAECKHCAACARRQDDDKMLFCDLCDRGFHIYCVGLPAVPSGRWHCVECAVCKSCGSREPGGPPRASEPAPSQPTSQPAGQPASQPAQWHHHTKRGPGGHKLYSHSLCTPCARAYRIGRYCPLCDRSFIGPKGNLQLIICKLCDRQHHQDCVRQTASSVRVLDYTCGECRRAGITSRAAAVRHAPRTIATLFMAKRRFNKYAHRQYMQSRLKLPAAADDDDEVSDPAEVADPLADDSLMDFAD